MRKIMLVLAVVALAIAAPAIAGKGGNGGTSAHGGGGGGGGHKGSGSTGTFDLVLLGSQDDVPNYGEAVTFTVTSTAAQPWVQLTCYQNGDWVINQYVGFYEGYPWSQEFPLSSWKWLGGAADCDARLFDGTTDATLATMSFHVGA